VSYPGEHIKTIETRFGQAIERMFDTPETAPLAPPPHLWPAYLHSTSSNSGYYRAPNGTSAQPAVQVRVNHGSWQTPCPFCLHSAQHASKTDRWFYCGTCHNSANDYRAIPVEWPSNISAVEALLLERPNRENRNWLPYETVTDLERENTEHL
jgi:hypothetical protein